MDLDQTSREVVRRFYDELWNQWQLELTDEIIAPTIRFRGSLGFTASGRQAFAEYVERVRSAFPDWHNQIDELLVVRDRVVARLTWTGTHQGQLGDVAATGRRVEYVGAALFRIEGAQISEAWIVGDTQELWRGLGLLSP